MVHIQDVDIVDGRSVDIQYSNWMDSQPRTNRDCVVVTDDNEWISLGCDHWQHFVCQSQ